MTFTHESKPLLKKSNLCRGGSQKVWCGWMHFESQYFLPFTINCQISLFTILPTYNVDKINNLAEICAVVCVQVASKYTDVKQWSRPQHWRISCKQRAEKTLFSELSGRLDLKNTFLNKLIFVLSCPRLLDYTFGEPPMY